jgi:hypothetical protein
MESGLSSKWTARRAVAVAFPQLSALSLRLEVICQTVRLRIARFGRDVNHAPVCANGYGVKSFQLALERMQPSFADRTFRQNSAPFARPSNMGTIQLSDVRQCSKPLRILRHSLTPSLNSGVRECFETLGSRSAESLQGRRTRVFFSRGQALQRSAEPPHKTVCGAIWCFLKEGQRRRNYRVSQDKIALCA